MDPRRRHPRAAHPVVDRGVAATPLGDGLPLRTPRLELPGGGRHGVHPDAPGRFAVTDRLLFRPVGVYGCCALALTARQPRLAQGWGGGDRIAFHATLAAGTIGTAASHGCLRTSTRDVRRLVRSVPLGSPVRIGA